MDDCHNGSKNISIIFLYGTGLNPKKNGNNATTKKETKMTIDSILDFGAIATAVTPLLTAALLAGATLGAGVMVARFGWRFFKGFSKG
jgi:hypothetical protein